MNIASAELLQQAFQNAGDSFARSRALAAENAFRNSQLDLEKKRVAVDQSFRDAQGAHYNAMETAASDHNAAMETAASDRLTMEQANATRPTFQWTSGGVTHAARSLSDFQAQIQQYPADKDDDGTHTLTMSGTNAQGVTFSQKIKAPSNLASGSQGAQSLAATVKTFADAFGPVTPKPNAASEDTVEDVFHHPAVSGRPAVPPVHHMFSADEPGQPSVPDSPAWEETIRRHIANGGAIIPGQPATQPPSATMPPSEAAPPVQPPESHVSWLQQNVNNPAAQAAAVKQYGMSIEQNFDAKYGAGSAAKYLSQNPQQPIPGGGGFPIAMPPGTSQTPPDGD